ncbi:MAG: hypothetical protein KA010_04140 [Saprospiraceae bacterium]|nr:hypothetical protein [Saprospiraceae bacterium]
MLCIFYSGLRVHLCFVHNGKNDWLPSHLNLKEYSAQEVKRVLSEILSTWQTSFPINTKRNDDVFPYSVIIPTWLEKSSFERILTDLAVEHTTSKCYHYCYLQEAFSQSNSMSKLSDEEPTLLIDGTDDVISILEVRKSSKYNDDSWTSLQNTGLKYYTELHLAGINAKCKEVGVTLFNDDRQRLTSQIQHNHLSNSFNIYHESDSSTLNLNINVSEDEVAHQLLLSVKPLAEYLKYLFSEKKHRYNVIFLGKYLQISYIYHFFVGEFKLKTDSLKFEFINDTKLVFDSVAESCANLANNQRVLQRNSFKHYRNDQVTKKELILDIQRCCNDINQFDDYFEQYLPTTLQLGLHSEVLEWLIVESILDKTNVTSKTLIDSYNDAGERQVVSSASPKSMSSVKQRENHSKSNKNTNLQIQHEVVVSDTDVERSLLSYIEQEHEIMATLFGGGRGMFALKVRTLSAPSMLKVIYAITSTSLLQRDMLGEYQECYRRNSLLNSSVSDIFSVKDGCYFTRDFIEGEALESYAINTGLCNKKNVKDFSIDDLKLILMVWKLVGDLSFNFHPIRSNDILVISRLKWNLKREFRLELVGLHGKGSSKEEMIRSVHTMFENLLGQHLYHSFRTKFKI